MERISDRLRGSVELELFGAFPAGVLNSGASEGIELWDVQCRDEHSLRLKTFEKNLPRLERLARRAGCETEIRKRVGGREGLRRVLRRPVLLAGLLLMALLLTASSLFVWDVEVRGTRRLSRGEVLRALEDCGFGVGSFWPGVKTDLLRSEVMVRLPELAWMAVNVSGSRAAVAIVERQPKPEMYDAADAQPRRRAGRPCAPGQCPRGQRAGEGGRDRDGGAGSDRGQQRFLKRHAPAVRARGSVMADTWYELSAVCPVEERLKTPAGVPHSRFALVFGKRRLNLYIGSGKTIDGCDKIISEYTLGMPGLFSTPLRLVRERFVPYRESPGDDYDPKAAGERLYALLEVRTEGQILESALTPGRAGELHVLTLRAHCTENIAIADG